MDNDDRARLIHDAAEFGASPVMVAAMGDVARDERNWERANEEIMPNPVPGGPHG